METGGSWCVCALGRTPGDLLAIERFPTGPPGETLERIVGFFTARERPRPRALGVGAFGPLELDERSPHWGEILATTPKPGWGGTPIGRVLRDGLDVPVALHTDVGAAALGELRWGAGRGVGSLAYLTVGTGIGAGLAEDGRISLAGRHPEAGHLRVPHDHARDPFAGSCPFHGDCWEGLASGTALRERWQADPEQLPDDHPAWALEAEYLAAGVLALVMVAAPRRIVLGGGVMRRRGLLERTRAELTRLLGGYPARSELAGGLDDYLVAPALADRSGVLGALALAQGVLAGGN